MLKLASDLSRRSLLAGIGGLGVSSCVGADSVAPLMQRPEAYPASAVKVSRDRILKTVRGLRPSRYGGFRLEMEKLASKTVIHSYGHGGDGVTLSWGSAAWISEQVRDTEASDIAIIGAGVQGLTAALVLAKQGKSVTVYAADFTPNVTSDIAGAYIQTASSYGRVDQRIVQRVNKQSDTGFYPYLSQTEYGVDEVIGHHLQCGMDLTDLPFEDKIGGCYRDVSRPKIVVDMSLYLPRLMLDIRDAGGSFYTKRFEAIDEVLALPQPVIVNCTGLGAGALFGDADLVPVWGQLALLEPQSEIDYAYTSRGSEGMLYMFPRKTSIVLGGTRRRGETSLAEDPQDIERLLRGHGAISAAIRNQNKVFA